MALDSKGNPSVDFAWGNFPMQPNDDRKTSAAPVTLGIVYADEKSGLQRFYTEAQLPEEFVVGAEFEVSGFSQTALNRAYVIESIEALSATTTYIKTTTPYIAYEGMSSPPSATPKVATLDPSKNLGGGTGDYGWGKTTKKVSENLDPALDGHIIATSGWNGYPGYTPGVSEPPFTPINFTANNGGQWQLQTGRFNMGYGFYDGNGFTFTIAEAALALGTQAWTDIQAAVAENKLAGATLTYSGISTMYGDLAGSGQGFEIIAAWIAPDYANSPYGADSVYLKTVPVEVNGIDLPPYMSTDGYLNSYATFAITAGTGKTGFTVAEIAASYDDVPDVQYSVNWMSYQNAWLIPTVLLTPEQTSTLLDPATVGKFISTSHIKNDPSHMNSNVVRAFCDQITQVDEYTDSYNNTFIRVYHDAANDQSGMTGKELVVGGEKLVILV